jgi:tetratricopeptide (TPR) repeat protein
MKHAMIALACTAALAWPLAASADGGGGGGGGGGGSGPAATLHQQDADYAAGMAAVKRQDWKQAAQRMTAYVQRQPEDADGWNELGHALRRDGQMQPAFDAYGKALKIDPRHRGAHEYLGEAYLQVGDLARAEQELRTLDKLCFFSCEEYRDLKEAIEAYRKGGGKQARTGW